MILSSLLPNSNSTLYRCFDDLVDPEVHVSPAYGGMGGSSFNDSIDKSLSSSDQCTSVVLHWYDDVLASVRFVYSGNITGTDYGSAASHKTETFHLRSAERISTIHIFLGQHRWAKDIENSTVIGIQFLTTFGYKTQVYGSSVGQRVEEPNRVGYTFGYAAGRAGAVIERLQFVWYKFIFD